jgi:putative flavoprotein involved in K+ transport
VRLTGRLLTVDGARVGFARDLAATAAAADARLARVLDRIDAVIAARGLDAPPGARPPRARPAEGPASLDLEVERIATVIWATGYVRRYPWLAVPGALDRRGEIVHRHGVTPITGLYALGLRMQRTRRSSFIDGVGDDARFLAARIAARSSRGRSVAA